MEDFAKRISSSRTFLKKLKDNNNREWFQDHKKAYEAAVKNPGNLIGQELGEMLKKLTGHDTTYKLFRINRDVRFSKDKTPYNSHLHVLWSNGGKGGFFFGVSPDYVTAGCGVMGLQKTDLDNYRALVDREGSTLRSSIENLKELGYRLDDPELKRVPAPYDKEHPHGDLLRRKSLTLWNDLDPDGLEIDHVFQCFETLLPIYKFCGHLK